MKLWAEHFENKNYHIIAYNENHLVGYHNRTKKAIFKYSLGGSITYTTNLLSETNNKYQIWVKDLFKKLHYSFGIKETKKDYFTVVITDKN